MEIHWLLPFLRKLKSVIPPWQIRYWEATEEIQKELKLQSCPLGAVTLTADGCVNNIKFASYLTGNRPLTCKWITKRQRSSNSRTTFHVIHLQA